MNACYFLFSNMRKLKQITIVGKHGEALQETSSYILISLLSLVPKLFGQNLLGLMK